jgi:hypothetical protein
MFDRQPVTIFCGFMRRNGENKLGRLFLHSVEGKRRIVESQPEQAAAFALTASSISPPLHIGLIVGHIGRCAPSSSGHSPR